MRLSFWKNIYFHISSYDGSFCISCTRLYSTRVLYVSVLFFISSYYYYQNFKCFKRINDARNFKKTFKGLEKTRKKVANAFSLISNKSYLDESDIELLEDCLSQADISYPIIENVVDALKVKDSSSINWKDRAHKVLLSKLAISQSADDIKKVVILLELMAQEKLLQQQNLHNITAQMEKRYVLLLAILIEQQL